ncbi:MAG: copper resistance system multicopper oxidase [Salinisphaeraceae bacterium]|nr:copper resistance system multicopper oxidase [Salinisphaeraceae bacterium]
MADSSYISLNDAASMASRRQFIQGLGALGLAGLAGNLWIPAWARGAAQPQILRGTEFDLNIGETAVNFTGTPRFAPTINGSIPGPTIRWREGDTVTLRVTNRLMHDTSIHWHGILLPANMDGVPGLSFKGIAPGETFTYQFKVKQSGTYWYHSHSMFQEQTGLYAPLIIEPREPEPFSYDRDYVVMLSDWTDEDPKRLFAKLKKQSDYYNFNQQTLGDLWQDIQQNGLNSTVENRKRWGEMRMMPTDLADVSAYTYTYLMNGITPSGNWTGLFKKGEKIRLRFINGAAMTFFDVRIPGLKMTVVAADGQNIHPVSVDEFRIGVAETYDVIVEPESDTPYTIFAQSQDRSGYARGSLTPHAGLQAAVPETDPRPLLTMADMGHGHDSAMHHSMHGGHNHQGNSLTHPSSEQNNPFVDMQTMAPEPRLDDPGIGLRDNGRKVLTYADMHSLFEDPDGRDPGREIELHLTGHMERYVWSFNGIKFADAEPLRLKYGERVRIKLVNDTMMEHPIHLHGVWSDLEDEHGHFLVRKHTVNMPPGTVRSYRVTADALGRWAYHCHLMYHMEAGMFREVRIEEGGKL